MDKLTKKKTNKIIITTVIIMLCNFAMPNYVHADDDSDNGGVLFKYVIPTVLMIPDLLIGKLQQIFVADDSDIAIEDPEGGITHYSIMYSPGAIFSGRIPGFDVNFISPSGVNGIVDINYDEMKYTKLAEDVEYNELVEKYGLKIDDAKETETSSSILERCFWFRKRCYFYYLETRKSGRFKFR